VNSESVASQLEKLGKQCWSRHVQSLLAFPLRHWHRISVLGFWLECYSWDKGMSSWKGCSEAGLFWVWDILTWLWALFWIEGCSLRWNSNLSQPGVKTNWNQGLNSKRLVLVCRSTFSRVLKGVWALGYKLVLSKGESGSVSGLRYFVSQVRLTSVSYCGGAVVQHPGTGSLTVL